MASPRLVGVALDFSPSSKYALTWAIDNIVRAGDTLMLLIVQKMQPEDGLAHLWEENGAPIFSLADLSDPEISKQHYHLAQDSALLQQLTQSAQLKKITVQVKIYYGDARFKLTGAVSEQKLDCLVTGNRGQGNVKRMLLGSVSDHVVHNASCPVVVVKNAA